MTELSPADWAVLPMKRYAKFSGRAPRAEYWWFTLGTTVIGLVLDLVDKGLGETGIVGEVFSLATIVPTLAVGMRRLHDIDRSGWWVVALILSFVPIGYFAFLAGNPLANSSLAAPTMGIILSGFVAFGLCLTLFIFSVLPGTVGDNRYGRDPYGPDSLEEVFA